MDAPGIIAQTLFHFFLSFLLGYFLFREYREIPNPFKWSKTDRVLLLMALFYLFGGLIPLLSTDHFLGSIPGHETTGGLRNPLGLWAN